MTQTLYFIIGHPIGQARSPEVFNARFVAAGLDAVMVPIEVAPADVEAVLASLWAIKNCAGGVVTIPHKIAAASLATAKSERVKITGAANVLRKSSSGWDAELCDGEGFVAALRKNGHDPAGLRAAVVGAGGAGLAIAAALLDHNAREVRLHDINGVQADSAVTRLKAHYGERVRRGQPDDKTDLAINATPVGMAAADPLPIDLAQLSANALVADIIMKPPVTHLLLEAKRRGHRIQHGHDMLDSQVDLIWRFLDMSASLSPKLGRSK